MLQFDWDKMQVTDIEGRLVKTSNVVCGRTRIRVLIEGIGILALDFRKRRIVHIERHGLMLHKNIRAQVIQASNMVLMFVRDEHRVELGDVLAQHLLAEVGTRIHDDRHLISLDQNGGTETFVAKVLGLAHGTGAADDGYALRCSAS